MNIGISISFVYDINNIWNGSNVLLQSLDGAEFKLELMAMFQVWM